MLKVLLVTVLLITSTLAGNKLKEGKFSLKNKGRVHNSKNAMLGEFPGLVYLRTVGDKVVDGELGTYVSSCTGSLIDHKTILTAAHCCCGDLGQGFPQEAMAGVIDAKRDSPMATYKIKSCIIHDKYESEGYCEKVRGGAGAGGSATSYDIAILKTYDTIQPSFPYINFVNLDFNVVPGDEVVTIAGYGRTEADTSGELRAGRLLLHDCEIEGISIGGTEKNVCYFVNYVNRQRSDVGDSGGPMFRGMYREDVEKFRQIGVNSGKIQLCLKKNGAEEKICIGAYVSTRAHKDFIEKYMERTHHISTNTANFKVTIRITPAIRQKTFNNRENFAYQL